MIFCIDANKPRRLEHNRCARDERSKWWCWTGSTVCYYTIVKQFYNEMINHAKKKSPIQIFNWNINCRAHRNDMENILPYLSAGLFYVMTDPNPTLAIILFPVTTIARLLHTFVYAVYVVRQPARAILYTIHICITLYMAFMCIVHGIQN